MSYKIIYADKVLCGKDLVPQEKQAIIIENDKIKEILPQDRCPEIEGAEIISLKDSTVMPVMIECHNHLSIDSTIPDDLEFLAWSTECDLTLIALVGLKKDLMSGVTTARCMGDRFYIDVTLKKLINEGKVAGPKLLAGLTPVPVKGIPKRCTAASESPITIPETLLYSGFEVTPITVITNTNVSMNTIINDPHTLTSKNADASTNPIVTKLK